MTTLDERPAPTFDLKRAGDILGGLRALADLFEANPELTEDFRYSDTFRKLHLPSSYHEDPRGTLAAWARAGKASGATVVKDYDAKYSAVTVALTDEVKVYVYADREQVCERVVTGTETVTVQVPDPTVVVPLVDVTEVREIVEWRCTPLLAEGTVE